MIKSNEWYGVAHRNIQTELFENFRNETKNRVLFSHLISGENRMTNVKCEITDNKQLDSLARMQI